MNLPKAIDQKFINELALLDPRSHQGLNTIFKIAELFLHESSDIRNLNQYELEIRRKNDFPILLELGIKAAISRNQVLNLKQPVKIEIVVPMYHEVIRLSPRKGSIKSHLVNNLPENENGEDELLRKYLEMEWLTRDSKLSYHIRVVDDICNQNSGKATEDLIKLNKLDKRISVYFLKDYINLKKEENPFIFEAVKKVIDRQDSVRGGSLCLGFAKAIEENKQNNEETLLSYIDADNSYSLTMIGIPISMLLSNQKLKIVTANRQHPLTRLDEKKTTTVTSARSNGLIRLKQTIGYIRKNVLNKYVPSDTQSGFKVMRMQIMEELLWEPNKANNFSYDTQLLSRIANKFNFKSIDTFGVVLIESDELTTANNDKTYYNAVKILNTINSESPKTIDNNVRYILNVISTYENYLELLSFLDDKSPELFFPNDSNLQQRLSNLRESISTKVDSTAVGKYYNIEILNDLVLLFNYYMMGINSVDLELMSFESDIV